MTFGDDGFEGSTASVTGTSCTAPLSASPPLSMPEAALAVASTTALAMSLAFCGDVEVAVTWMRGLDGSTWYPMLALISPDDSVSPRASMTRWATSPLWVSGA